VLVTRTRDQASELSERLMELGADVIEAPTIEIVPPADDAMVIDALCDAQTGKYNWVVFTSANGVRRVKERLFSEGWDARSFCGVGIAAIGDATAAALAQELGIRADLVPPEAIAESLADALDYRGEIAGKAFLLLRADIGRPILIERLRSGGAALIDDVAVYETKPAKSLPPELIEALDDRRVTWATFTSSSTATNLASLLGPQYRDKLAGVKVASIGPVTTATLRELGLDPTVEARVASIDGLVEAITSSK